MARPSGAEARGSAVHRPKHLVYIKGSVIILVSIGFCVETRTQHKFETRTAHLQRATQTPCAKCASQAHAAPEGARHHGRIEH